MHTGMCSAFHTPIYTVLALDYSPIDPVCLKILARTPVLELNISKGQWPMYTCVFRHSDMSMHAYVYNTHWLHTLTYTFTHMHHRTGSHVCIKGTHVHVCICLLSADTPGIHASTQVVTHSFKLRELWGSVMTVSDPRYTHRRYEAGDRLAGVVTVWRRMPLASFAETQVTDDVKALVTQMVT